MVWASVGSSKERAETLTASAGRVGVPASLRIAAPITQRSLEDRLRREALRTPQPMIELRADKTTQYKQIAEAMATVKNAGIRKLGFITEPNK